MTKTRKLIALPLLAAQISPLNLFTSLLLGILRPVSLWSPACGVPQRSVCFRTAPWGSPARRWQYCGAVVCLEAAANLSNGVTMTHQGAGPESESAQQFVDAVSPAVFQRVEVFDVPGLRVEKLASWDEIKSFEQAWNELLAASDSQTIFLTWEWVQAWWRAFGSTRHLVLLTCRDAEGDLVAIVPLQRTWENIGPGMSGWMLRLVGDDIGGSENLDWIVRRGREAAAVRAVLDWLEENRSEWDTLELNTVPAHSPVAAALRHELAVRRWRLIVHEGVGYFRWLPDNWEAFVASLPRNMRAQIRSRLRRVQSRFTLQLRRCESLEELPECLAHLYSLHTKRWQLRGKSGSFDLTEKRIFYTEMGKRFLERGWLDFWQLDLDGQTVAVEFGFHHDTIYSFLQAGFDPDYAAYSVGRVLRCLIIEELIRRGIRGYDFLGGADEYKQRYGAQRLTYLSLASARPHSWGAAGLALRDGADKSKAWLRARLHEKLWAMLKRAYWCLPGGTKDNTVRSGGSKVPGQILRNP